MNEQTMQRGWFSRFVPAVLTLAVVGAALAFALS